MLLGDLRDDAASVRLPAGVMPAYVGDPAAMPEGWRQCRNIAGRLLLETSPAQAGIGDVLENRDGLRDAVESVAVGRAVFERCGGGDLRSAERAGE